MNTSFRLDQCLSFINCHLQAPKLTRVGGAGSIKCVTISRQSGCGAHVFAEELAACLQSHLPGSPAPWTIFDGSLVAAVLRDHHLPARMAAFMPEDRVSRIDEIVHNLFSLHPPPEELIRQTAETILRLAELGNVIIVGRGANIITAPLPRILHVRLVGSLKRRVSYMATFDNLNEKDALARIAHEDTGRARYLKRYFGEDIDNPLLYHLIINTDRTILSEAAAMVGALALRHNAPETGTHAKATA